MIRVYELPQLVSAVGYVFIGKPVEFLLVDWFGEPDDSDRAVGRNAIEKFVRTKRYVKADRRYLVIADNRPDLTFVLEPEV